MDETNDRPKAPEAPKMVTASFGPKNESLSPGKTVKDAAQKLGVTTSFLGLRKPSVFVNSKAVTNWNTVLRAGDRVEFTKATGGKG
jgi:hypothetical protein